VQARCGKRFSISLFAAAALDLLQMPVLLGARSYEYVFGRLVLSNQQQFVTDDRPLYTALCLKELRWQPNEFHR
jgi:hypothetical protein